MNARVLRILRVPLTVAIAWAVLGWGVPLLMTKYDPYVTRPGFTCAASVLGQPPGPDIPAAGCRTLSDLYRVPFADLFLDSIFRSLALIIGAAVLALVLGTLLGVAGALLRRRAYASGAIVAATTVFAAVPAFFVAYFLQIGVIVFGASKTAREFLLPVFGFGYDSHLILPLLAISLPAIAYSAQLTATRMSDVLDMDFITAAQAKGLRMRWIVVVHAFPHVRPVLLEALGSGLRVSVASLPIVEYLFLWRGIGQLSLEAIGIHDAPGLIVSALALVLLFAILSALADLSRPRALYRAA